MDRGLPGRKHGLIYESTIKEGTFVMRVILCREPFALERVERSAPTAAAD